MRGSHARVQSGPSRGSKSIGCARGHVRIARMKPEEFVKEVYRRMSVRHAATRREAPWSEMERDPQVARAECELRKILSESGLSERKDLAILDLGFGGGWFLAACLKLGFRNLSGADFGIEHKEYIKRWSEGSIALYEIENDIGDFLADKAEQFEFIHMSHVIEHIPKYSLLWVGDALYRALKPGGMLMLRTPNMEGPCANSSYYVTLAHEYGFSGANLESLLDVCGFDDIRFHRLENSQPSLKQVSGTLIRKIFLAESRVRHRLFGVNEGGVFDAELVMTGRRGKMTPLFDEKYR
jgi:2-polyprenyl-3-methyl-5-hydroxy-6-metoxy-1,4-benzoquinol methylase